ncbi:MAG: magnesium/cobalt transporter CorA [Candidatus Aenigmarchaeota archaeon]|nr:magnesium/cobalt transporter CorA [Candidatus Aenigmarchaeota archaeon]NIP40539.1 magnesium/cobalt transporter CorA [Candidatus Aenigmarchaeota archaeon]NIQ18384.1 magnesium/cobalt transporter CorA [Candidatus Aenigmarchaeota archaeon]
MRKIISRRKKAGLPPGTLVHVGEKKQEKSKITIIDYDEKKFHEKEAKDIKECFPFSKTKTVTWINIDGVHDVNLIKELGGHFGFHPLLQEDIVNTEQRPKMEEFDDHIFIVLKMLYYDEKIKEIVIEQISLVFGPNYVISFQEREGDVFNPVRERIRNGKKIIKLGSDYLAYALIDAVVDHYFAILERLGEIIEGLEGVLISDPKPETLHKIHRLKREMIFLRKSVWPLREVISLLQRTETSLIKRPTKVYLRDVYDHTIQVIDTVETFRDMVSGMLDTYLSSVSNRMNEVMKVLTIIATIFIPLTFIAGIYGMNFQYMPELEWAWGYYSVWFVMLMIALLMFAYFRRKKWL